jgi:hypothetical protein
MKNWPQSIYSPARTNDLKSQSCPDNQSLLEGALKWRNAVNSCFGYATAAAETFLNDWRREAEPRIGFSGVHETG